MYTTILFYMMLAGAVTRLVSAGMLAMMGRINLPAGLVVLSVAVALLGLGLVAKRCLGKSQAEGKLSFDRRCGFLWCPLWCCTFIWWTFR